MTIPDAQFHTILDQTNVQVFPEQNVQTLTADTEPLDAFQTLLTHGYLSAPVVSHQPNGTTTYYGFLETRDLVKWVVFSADDANVTPSLQDIVHHGVKLVFTAIDAVNITYMARTHPFHPLPESSSLYQLCKHMVSKRSHRVPVINESKSISRLITQSSLLQYLHDHHNQLLPNTWKTAVQELDLINSPVISAKASQSTLEVLGIMEKKNLSGIAIVNEQGQLVAATSAHDLRLFLHSRMQSQVQSNMSQDATLSTPIMDFLNVIRQQALQAHVPVLVCTPGDSFGEIVGKLVATRSHRIFVIHSDEDRRPLGVIALTNIIKCLMSE